MTILVTRPSPAGEQLVSRLRALGRVAYHAPLIDFSPGHDLPKLPALLQEMQAGDLVFALSQNAVRYANPLLKRNNLSWPTQLSYYAIGRGTALALHTASRLHVTFPPWVKRVRCCYHCLICKNCRAKKRCCYAGMVDESYWAKA